MTKIIAAELQELVDWTNNNWTDVKIAKPRTASKTVRTELLTRIRTESLGYFEVENHRLTSEDLCALIDDPGAVPLTKIAARVARNPNFDESVKTALRGSKTLITTSLILATKATYTEGIETDFASAAIANHGILLTTWHLEAAGLSDWTPQLSDEEDGKGQTDDDNQFIILNFDHLLTDGIDEIVSTVKRHVSQAAYGNSENPADKEVRAHLNDAALDNLFLQYLKKKKQPFAFTGLTLTDLMTMARNGELD